MKAKATAPHKRPADQDRAPAASKHDWRGGGVEEPEVEAGHLSESPEAAATRAEGNGPVEASTEANRSRPPAADDKEAPPARRENDHQPNARDAKVIDELKRQAAAEEHAAARGGKLVRGPI